MTKKIPRPTTASPSPSSLEGGVAPDTSSKSPQTNSFKDRKERAVAELLTRFKNLVSLAAMPVEDGATKEVAAAQAFQMEIESAALVRASEDLLKLTRELKELWLFGPLRDIGEGEGEGKIDENSTKVGELVDAILKRNMEELAT